MKLGHGDEKFHNEIFMSMKNSLSVIAGSLGASLRTSNE